MATIKLKVSDKILDKVLWLLKQFNIEDLEIIESDVVFDENMSYVHSEFERLKSGKSTMYSIDEADEMLEKVIREYED